jgi:hypothetical protein
VQPRGLVERETIREISSVVVANRALLKLRHAEVAEIVEKLRGVVGERA